MKINKVKFVGTALAICCSAALIGSITNTIAWYQFSTRASAVYLGASTGKNSKLRLRIKGTDKWITDLTYRDVNDYLASVNKGLKITPITSGFMGADDPIKIDENGQMVFYQNPEVETLERVAYDSPSWRRANELMYVSLPLEISYTEEDDGGDHYLEKEVYISNLTIQDDYRNKTGNNDKKDLSKAVRVHISSYQSNNQLNTSFNRLISKNGGTILTEGYWDGDGDGDFDEYIEGHGGPIYEGFNNEETEKNYVVYGEGLQTSYSNQYDIRDGSYKTLDGQTVNEKIYPAVVKSLNDTSVLDEDSFEYTKEGSEEKTSKCIGKTVAFEGEQNESYLNVIMTIWVEGWEPLPSSSNNNDESSIWNASDYIGSMFDVGIEFAVQTE